MAKDSLTERQSPTATPLALAGVLGLSLLVCAVAISDQSFWIDECGVAQKAMLPTLKAFWQQISTEGSADLQQPFHHFYAWGWEKVFGIDEFGLRSANIPFLLLGMAVVFFAFRGTPGLLAGMLLAAFTSPFVWYYLNEARPYSVQLCASLIVFSSMFKLSKDQPIRNETSWVWILCSGIVLLAVSGMLAMLWLGAYILAALLATPQSRLKSILARHLFAFALTALLLLGMGMFYLWTLSIGARATAVGGTDLRNFAFIVFEVLGFSGFGPGRLAIRNDGLRAFAPWIHWLALYGLALLAVLFAGLRTVRLTFPARVRWSWLLSFLLVAFFILGVGVVAHFRVLGRHCTPVFPLVLFILGAGASSLWANRRSHSRWATPIFACIAIASCLMVRFNERHSKDDYRSAARVANASLQKGEVVWWSASPEGAIVYGLPLSTNVLPGSALFVANPESGFAAGLPAPSLVVSSKPDVYDAKGALALFLKGGYKPATNFVAFAVWREQGQQEASQTLELSRPPR